MIFNRQFRDVSDFPRVRDVVACLLACLRVCLHGCLHAETGRHGCREMGSSSWKLKPSRWLLNEVAGLTIPSTLAKTDMQPHTTLVVSLLLLTGLDRSFPAEATFTDAGIYKLL